MQTLSEEANTARNNTVELEVGTKWRNFMLESLLFLSMLISEKSLPKL